LSIALYIIIVYRRRLNALNADTKTSLLGGDNGGGNIKGGDDGNRNSEQDVYGKVDSGLSSDH